MPPWPPSWMFAQQIQLLALALNSMSAFPPMQSYSATMAAKLGLAEYDQGIAAGLMRLMYEDSGG